MKNVYELPKEFISFNRSEEDDFWSDAKKIRHDLNHSINMSIINSDVSDNEIKNNRRTFSAEHGRKKREKTPILKKTRIDSLYQIGLEKKKKIEMLEKESHESQIKNEIKECTFKPKLNTKYKPSKVGNTNTPIYERQQLWQNQKIEKLEKKKMMNKSDMNKQFTFAPEITKTIPKFENESVENRSTKTYYDRLNKAKLMKDELKNKQILKYDNFNKRQMMRNSMKENSVLDIIENQNDDYCTFYKESMVKNKKTYVNALKNLHHKLHDNVD